MTTLATPIATTRPQWSASLCSIDSVESVIPDALVIVAPSVVARLAES
jgi:hypothetical protein